MTNFATRRRAATKSLELAGRIVLGRVNIARIEREEPALDSFAELQRLIAEDEWAKSEFEEIVADVESRLDPSTLQTYGEAQERRTRAIQAAAPVADELTSYTGKLSQADNFGIVDEIVERSIDANQPERMAQRAVKSAFARRDPNSFFDAARDGKLSHDDVEAALADVQPPSDDELLDPVPQHFQERAAKADTMSVKDLGRLLEEVHAETETD